MQDSNLEDYEGNEVEISESMTADQIDSAFSRFEARVAAVKRDRDRMMSERHETPIPRFSNLVSQLMAFSAVEVEGHSVTRKEISALKERISDFFLKKHTVGSESVSYFSLIMDVFSKFCKDLFSKSNQVNKHAADLLYHSIGVLENLTDCSPNFSRQVASNDDLMRSFLKIIQQFSEGHIKRTLDDAVLEILKASIVVVYNMVRLSDSENVVRVRELGFIEAIKPLLKSHVVGIKSDVTLFLIFAASEDDAKKCCCDLPTIKFLMVNLKGALASKDHRNEGYSDVELMEAIRKLAVIDENKKILAKLGCLQLMKGVLENYKHGGDDDEVVTLAFAILSQLAFDRDNAKWIDKEMRSLLDSKFMKSPQSELREAASTLKWTVDRGTEPVETSRARGGVRRPLSARAPPKQKHIMVSYNHASKDFVKKLVRTLEDANLGKVWVDFNDMEGDLNDAMAFAVENAWVVLVCVSLKYKDSENCKLEALYAKTRGVSIIPLKVEKWKPDGWLGLLIASALYYNFSKEDCCEETMDNLLEALREKCGRTDSMDGRAAIRATSSKPLSSEPARKPPFYSWSCADVQKWCKDNGIPGRQCANLDGRQLRMLKDMRQSEQAVFFKELQDEFKFTLKEKSAFVDALDAL